MILLSMFAILFTDQGAPADCRRPDAAMLALPLQDFDQGDNGWRSLDVEGCELVVAEALARYREINREAQAGQDASTLVWHEGQLRAAAGQTDAAIALMLQGRDEESDAIQPYVDASVAFLRRDRPALLAAHARLMALPVPEAFTRAADRYHATYPDLPTLTWPLNRDKVEGFIACFDRPYREAYVCDAEGNVP